MNLCSRAALRAACAVFAGCLLVSIPSARAGWEPTAPVEFVVPAGVGGGADQMARFMTGLITKNKLMPQPITVVNKIGSAGAKGFLYIKDAKGDPHKIVIGLTNLFSTPVATGEAFSWKDLTPVTMIALDQFVLWVNADSPYQSAKEYIAAAKSAGPKKFKMGGTSSEQQEDQIVTLALEKQTGVTFTYVPLKGGGDVVAQLVGKHIDSSVSNPTEAASPWRAGKVRPLCVFDTARMPYKTKVTSSMAWSDIPTCKEAGLDVNYLMLRGILMAGGVTDDQRNYYAGVVKQVRELPEWKAFIEKSAFNQTALTGDAYRKWLENEDKRNTRLMKEGGLAK